MARLSNVNEGLTQMAGPNPKSLQHTDITVGAKGFRVPMIYLQLIWDFDYQGQSTRQIENTLITPNSTKQLVAKSSPGSFPTPRSL